MSTMMKVGTGQLWLRVGIYAVAALLLEIALGPVLAPLSRSLVDGAYPTDALMFLPVLGLLPNLLAAILAWLLPRPVSLQARDAARPWFLSALLALLGAATVVVLYVNEGQMRGWSDSAALVEAAKDTWIGLWIALPQALVMALIAMTLLWGVARRVVGAAAAGAITAVAIMLPGVLATLLQTLRGLDTGASGLTTAQVTASWAVATAVQCAAWAVLYSGLGRLLDGRRAWSRALLATAVFMPLYATTTLGLPLFGQVSLGDSVLGVAAGALQSMVLPLALGLIAWGLSALKTRPASRVRAAGAAAA